jgi:hypothetical protein
LKCGTGLIAESPYIKEERIMTKKKKYPEGVEVTLPTKYENFTLIRRDKGKLPKGVSGRIVMKFDFKNPKTKKKHVQNFTKDLTIRVEYKKVDEDRVGKKKLILKFNRGKKWENFKPIPTTTPYNNKPGGYAEFKTKDWDPAVGWFP